MDAWTKNWMILMHAYDTIRPNEGLRYILQIALDLLSGFSLNHNEFNKHFDVQFFLSNDTKLSDDDLLLTVTKTASQLEAMGVNITLPFLVLHVLFTFISCLSFIATLSDDISSLISTVKPVLRDHSSDRPPFLDTTLLNVIKQHLQ